MSDFERLTIEDERTSATKNFIKWYIENRLDTKRKIKRLYDYNTFKVHTK